MKILFDSHAHINEGRYNEEKRIALVNDLLNSDLQYVNDVAFNIKSAKLSIEYSNKYDFIYASVGVHPHEVKNMTEEDIETLRELSKEKKVVAIGEIGLDYFKQEGFEFIEKELQIKWFEKQIKLAIDVELPIIIHDRDAHDDVMDVLVKNDAFNKCKGVLLHCFSGDVPLMNDYLNLGAYISLSGTVTFKNAKDTHEVATLIPTDKLLIETDSPYLTPEPFRGKPNNPKNVEFVARKIAGLKDMPYEEIAEITTNNAKRFFNIK